jgi:GGDEF domain-containing protein
MDGFKQINDRFGHLEGNRVLRLFAQALKDSCREYDYVARMGGDEFVVIAPGLAADAAGKKAEQMRALARQAGSEVCGEDILSLSVKTAEKHRDSLMQKLNLHNIPTLTRYALSSGVVEFNPWPERPAIIGPGRMTAGRKAAAAARPATRAKGTRTAKAKEPALAASKR